MFVKANKALFMQKIYNICLFNQFTHIIFRIIRNRVFWVLRKLFTDESVQGYLDRASRSNPAFVAYTDEQQQQLRKFADQLFVELTVGKTPQQDGQPTFTLATGVPGAGKTTHLKKLVAEGANLVVVDNDDIREKLPFFQQALKEKLDAGATDRTADRYAFLKHIRAVQFVSRTVMNRLLEQGYNVAYSALPSRFGYDNVLGMRDKKPNLIAQALELDHKVQLWIFEASDTTLKRSFEKRAKATNRYAVSDDLTPQDYDVGKIYEDLKRWPVQANIFWRKSVNAPAVEVASFSRSGEYHAKDDVLAEKIWKLRHGEFSIVNLKRFNAWSTRLGDKSNYSFDDTNPLRLD